ncbi:MAG: hypothetical protein AAGA37_00015 [Actinomycetota bacterium]
MKQPLSTSFLAVLAAIALFTVSCAGSAGSDAPAADPGASAVAGAEPATSVPDGARSLLDDAVVAAAEGYERTIGVWDGFDPREHPTVVPLRENGEVVEALLINHTNPGALGTATGLDPAETPFASLHRVVLNDEYRQRLEQTEHFEFNAMIGDVDSFIMVADRNDSFLDPSEQDWAATLIHEMFHRYQEGAFTWGFGGQDIDGYAYTQENLALALLEERALRAALTADSDAARIEAARHFSGLRLARLAADGRVELDNSQEHIEGTARYIEHRMSGTDERYSYHASNYDRDLLDGFTIGQIKDEYGFGRFYASGAAILRVLDLLAVDDVVARTEAGDAPAEILIDHLGVVAEDAPALTEAARAAYGDASVDADAAAAAAGVESEPSFWGDESGGEDGSADAGSPDGGDGEIIELTEEELACLDAAEIPEDGIVPDDVWEACVGA